MFKQFKIFHIEYIPTILFLDSSKVNADDNNHYATFDYQFSAKTVNLITFFIMIKIK